MSRFGREERQVRQKEQRIEARNSYAVIWLRRDQ
jgi:hypothetical protein